MILLLNQRHMVAESLLIPDHGVYRERVVPKALEEPELSHGSGEKWPSPEVMDEDHGEW